jgi:hypothetical protein
MKIKRNSVLGFMGTGLLVALAPLACGSSDGDNDNNTNGGSSSGDGGSGTAGSKAGSGGKSTAGSAGLGGADGTSGEAGNAGAGGAAPAPARLRIVHASPNAPSVDVYASEAALATALDVSYGTATDFVEVDAGPIAFDLRAAGADADEVPAFTSEVVELAAGADYTFIAAGDFALASDPDVGFRLLALEHDFDEAVAGETLTRVVHATPAWANVDLDIIATSGVDVPALAVFTDESNVALPAAASFDVAFQSDADGVLSKLTVPALTAGEELFAIATGNPGQPFRAPANGFALLVVDQDGNVSWVREQPWIHLLHVSDVSTVDVYRSTQTAAADKLADDLAGEALAGFQLPASAVGFTLKAVAGDAAAGTATALATGATSTLKAGEHYLGYIAGNTIETLHEQFDLEQSTKVVLRGAHSSTTIAETVDFGVAAADSLTSTLFTGVAPTEGSVEAGLAIEAGDLLIGAAATGTVTPLLGQMSFTGAAGERGFVLLAGAGDIWFVDTSVAGWSVR